ncbi:MAG: hypothetical protein ABSA54_12350 [Terriglobales bacterium]
MPTISFNNFLGLLFPHVSHGIPGLPGGGGNAGNGGGQEKDAGQDSGVNP